MKIKCANCNQRTISIKQIFLSTKKFSCPKCNTELTRESNKYLYYSLFLLSLVLVLLIVKLFLKLGINRYFATPLLPLMAIACLQVSSYTKPYSKNAESKMNLKEFLLTMIVLVPLIAIISTLLGF